MIELGLQTQKWTQMNAQLDIIVIPDQHLQRQKIVPTNLSSAQKETTVRKELNQKSVAQLELSVTLSAYAA